MFPRACWAPGRRVPRAACRGAALLERLGSTGPPGGSRCVGSPSQPPRLAALGKHGVCTPNSKHGAPEAGEPEGGDEEPGDAKIAESTPQGAAAGERLHALPVPLPVLC